MIIKHLIAKNILSFGETPLDITFDKALNVVTGDNGAGKSTIIDAIIYCLYGKPYRKINIADLINKVNDDGMEVELHLEVDGDQYVVSRNFRTFKIVKNGESVKRVGQDYIAKKITKCDLDMFCNTVVIGRNRYTPLLRSTKAQRRKALSGLLQMSKADDMLKKLKLRQSANVSDISSAQRAIMSKMQTLEQVDRAKEMYVVDQTLVDEVARLEREIEDFNSQEKITPRDVTKEKVARKKLGASISSRKAVIETVGNNSKCPKCSSVISEEFASDTISEHECKIEEIENVIGKLTAKIEKSENIAEEIRNDEWEQNSRITRLDEIRGKIESTQRNIDNLDETITIGVQDEIDQLRKKEAGLRTIAKKLDGLVEFFGDTGVKLEYWSNFLGQFNGHCREFLTNAGSLIAFELKDDFTDTVCDERGLVTKYEQISEGERTKIDFATIFAFRRLMEDNCGVCCNLIFFDEMFDSSISNRSAEYLVKAINSHYDIVTITHTPERFENCKKKKLINIEKCNGFSFIK